VGQSINILLPYRTIQTKLLLIYLTLHKTAFFSCFLHYFMIKSHISLIHFILILNSLTYLTYLFYH